MRGSAAFRTGVAPGGALAGPWVRDPLWTRARAVPSLDLRFADNKSLVDATTGQNLVTFTRASSGTFVGSNGLLQSAVTNLQRHSEDFTQGLTPINATLTANQGFAPNGTLTADEFLETAVNGLHSQEIVDHIFVAGVTYTFSCYAKSIGGRNFGPGFPVLFSSARFGFFNLSGSGSVVSTDAGVTASIQAVGDGWYRCSITSICVTGGGARVGTFIASGTSISYAGDITKGLLLWGAQLEQSTTAGEYIPTTSAINSAPRFDHNPTTGESLGLLVEEQRSNLLLQSSPIDTANGWSKGSNTTRIGTETLLGLTATIYQGNGSGNNTYVSQNPSIVSGTTYTFIFYARLVSGAKPTSGSLISIETTPGSPGIRASLSYASSSLSSDVSRYSLTFTAGGTGVIAIYLIADQNNTAQISVAGAQLEQGAFPTSYIPTTTAAATRSADVASITGSAFTGWYNAAAMTIFSEASSASGAAYSGYVYIIGPDFNNGIVHLRQSDLQPVARIRNASVDEYAATGNGPIWTGTLANRFALAVSTTSGRQASNGTLALGGDDTSITFPLVTSISIGSLNGSAFINGHLRRICYWPTRLANNVLQSITQ